MFISVLVSFYAYITIFISKILMIVNNTLDEKTSITFI